MGSTDDECDDDEKLYQAARESLLPQMVEAYRQYDKTLLWICGGAFAVSLTQNELIDRESTVIGAELLFWAWVAWGFCVLLVSVSFLIGALAAGHLVEFAETKHFEKVPYDTIDWKAEIRCSNGALKIINVASGLCLIVSVILYGVFLGQLIGVI